MERRDQLATDFCGGQTRVEPGTAKLGIGLALPIHESGDILQQVGQMLFTAFPASKLEGIHTHQSALQFMLAFPDRSTIPAQLLFGSTLPSFSQGADRPCHKKTTSAAL